MNPMKIEPADSIPPSRCEICDWPYAETTADGCVPGNCCYRPESGSEEHRRIAIRRRQLAFRQQNPGEWCTCGPGSSRQPPVAGEAYDSRTGICHQCGRKKKPSNLRAIDVVRESMQVHLDAADLARQVAKTPEHPFAALAELMVIRCAEAAIKLGNIFIPG